MKSVVDRRSLLVGRAIAILVTLSLASGVAAVMPTSASAGTFEVDACSPYTTTSGVFQHAAVFGIGTPLDCSTPPAGGMEIITGPNTVPAGTAARWYTETPSGLKIVAVVIPQGSFADIGVNAGTPTGWGGGFWWPGGGYAVYEGESSFGAFMNTSFFEWQIVCGWSTCNGSQHLGALVVDSIRLFIQETGSPSITPTSRLYGETGWIRGNGWPLSFSTDDPSGVCHVQATVGPTVFQGPTSNQDHIVYHQCSVTSFAATVNATDYPDGSLPITLEAMNAAQNWATPSSTVHVDNQPVGLSLSGPTDVPSTAGTQYITASAAAGPSGVSGIGCTLDGAPYQWYPVSTAQIPVSGLGIHHLTCYGANNAKDPSGNVATSPPQSWTLRIAEPTSTGISLTRIANPLRCRKVGSVVRCHPRTVREKVTVWRTVKRNGKTVRVKSIEWRRVVVPPQAVATSTLRVPYGKGTTVSGWSAAVDGTPLAGQPVIVYTAPDNGLQQFTPAATATTRANGAWSAVIEPGPSRLVEAAYGGAVTLEPSTSARVRVVVPAKVELSVTPRHVPWGGSVRIVGQLDGGYLPPGGENVRERYGIGSSFTTWGVHEHVTGSGRFSTIFQLGPGPASVVRRFWFQFETLPTSSYPFAPAFSERRYLLVGGHL